MGEKIKGFLKKFSMILVTIVYIAELLCYFLFISPIGDSIKENGRGDVKIALILSAVKIVIIFGFVFAFKRSKESQAKSILYIIGISALSLAAGILYSTSATALDAATKVRIWIPVVVNAIIALFMLGFLIKQVKRVRKQNKEARNSIEEDAENTEK